MPSLNGSRANPASSPLGPVPWAALIAVSAYVGTQLMADVGSVKIGRVGGLAMDLGTLIFPISFTLRDMVHKTLGRKGARAMVVIAAAINLAMAGFLLLCARIPGDIDWGLDAEFAAVLSPVGRIVLASILAQLCGQMVNTEAYHWFRSRVTRRHQWLRVLCSNSLAIPVDSVIFTVMAFGWALPWTTVGEILMVNMAVKLAVSVLGIPLIYTVRHVDRD